MVGGGGGVRIQLMVGSMKGGRGGRINGGHGGGVVGGRADG